jgi:hypothetical protein
MFEIEWYEYLFEMLAGIFVGDPNERVCGLVPHILKYATVPSAANEAYF